MWGRCDEEAGAVLGAGQAVDTHRDPERPGRQRGRNRRRKQKVLEGSRGAASCLGRTSAPFPDRLQSRAVQSQDVADWRKPAACPAYLPGPMHLPDMGRI